MADFYHFLKPLLMRMDAETAHRCILFALRCGWGPKSNFAHPMLRTNLWGRSLANPLGLAAGFDKNAEALQALFRMGFGFVEVGTVTPLAQEGNPRPRIFRDHVTESVVNRMGFPGEGLDVFVTRLKKFKMGAPHAFVGANIGLNKEDKNPIAAYQRGVERLRGIADYIAVNVSSPNTAGLRDLQQFEVLDQLLTALMKVRDTTPIVLKIAPDLTNLQRENIAGLALKHEIQGLLISNTTIARPSSLSAALQNEKGGLSGRLLKDMSTQLIGEMRKQTSGRIPIIGVGGVSSAADAYEKIRAGASAIQIYTALVFQGPALIMQILQGLVSMLEQDGFPTVSDAVGSDV